MGVIDIDSIKDIKRTDFVKKEKKDLMEGIESIQEPVASKKQIEKELGRELSSDFDNFPSSEELFGENKGIINYPLLLLTNIMCPEMLEAVVSMINEITNDDSITGKYINLYYSNNLGRVKFIGNKKINMDVFNYIKSYLVSVLYYESKHVNKEVQYEDFINFEEFNPKIVPDESSAISIKDKLKSKTGIPSKNDETTDVVDIQMELLKTIQEKDISNTIKGEDIKQEHSITPINEDEYKDENFPEDEPANENDNTSPALNALKFGTP